MKTDASPPSPAQEKNTMQSEIPEDVMKLAEATISRGFIGVNSVALAILAERKRCEAALSAAEPSVTVKALEWHGNFGKSPVGQTMCYRVLFSENGAGWGHPEKGRGYYAEQDSGFLVSGPHETHGLAKAAAQADYEARIRSALTAQVQDAGEDPDVLWTCHNNLSNMFFSPGASETENDDVWDFASQAWAKADVKLNVAAAPAKQEGKP